MRFDKEYYKIIKSEQPVLVKLLDRLKGITGFISIIGNNSKVRVFNRYYHIVRVYRLLNWYIGDLDGIDRKKCAFIGLFHDINRLPFAHNFEKHIDFSQADTLPYFMSLFNVRIEDSYYSEFSAFFNKKMDFSIESRIAFLIDIVEGFIEDPLFTFTTLGLNYKDVSDEIMSILGFDDYSKLDLLINKLNGLYNKDLIQFMKEFDDIVFDYAKAFINKYQNDKYTIFDDDIFLLLKDKIRNQFIVKQIFPINNEQVSNGKYLSENLAIPYLQYLNDNNIEPFKVLFTQTDNELLEAAIDYGIIKEEDKINFFPNLSL